MEEEVDHAHLLGPLDDDALAWLRDTVELRVASLNTRMNPPPADRNRHNALRWEATQARKVASALGTSSPVTN